jgi:hypothetical protein
MLARQGGVEPEPLFPDSLMPYATEDRPDPPPRKHTPRGWLALTCVLLALLVSGGTASGADDPTATPGAPVGRAVEDFEGTRGQEAAKGDDESEGREPAGDEETEPEQDEEEPDLAGIQKLNPLRVHWDKGLHVEGKWDYLHVKIAGDIQNDTAGFVNTESVAEYLGTEISGGVEWRRARAYAEGRLIRHLDFKLRYDFIAGNPPNLKDAYFSFVNLPIPTAGFTLGRFRAPLGLDGYTGADDLVFMERSLMSEAFLPSRNSRFMLHGDSPQRRMRWSVAALQPEDDVIDFSNNDNLGWSARFAWAFTKGRQGKTLVHLGADF